MTVHYLCTPRAATPAGKGRFWHYVGALLVVGVIIWSRIKYQEIDQERACRVRLVRVFYPSIRKDDALISTEEQAAGRERFRCPRCGVAYVYRPVSGALHNWAERERLRMIAWCPTHCHNGRRTVLLESGGAFTITEAVFQRGILADFALSGADVIEGSRGDPD